MSDDSAVPSPDKSGNGRRRRIPDDRLLAALISNPTMASAAAAVGCSERTVRRRLSEDAFERRYNEGVANLVDRSGIELALAHVAAIRRLRAIVESEHETVALKAIQLALCGVERVGLGGTRAGDNEEVDPHRHPAEVLGLSPDLDDEAALLLAAELHRSGRGAQ